jgi:hypothetical protein
MHVLATEKSILQMTSEVPCWPIKKQCAFARFAKLFPLMKGADCIYQTTFIVTCELNVLIY